MKNKKLLIGLALVGLAVAGYAWHKKHETKESKCSCGGATATTPTT